MFDIFWGWYWTSLNHFDIEFNTIIAGFFKVQNELLIHYTQHSNAGGKNTYTYLGKLATGSSFSQRNRTIGCEILKIFSLCNMPHNLQESVIWYNLCAWFDWPTESAGQNLGLILWLWNSLRMLRFCCVGLETLHSLCKECNNLLESWYPTQ